jgi:hypothetical protein
MESDGGFKGWSPMQGLMDDSNGWMRLMDDSNGWMRLMDDSNGWMRLMDGWMNQWMDGWMDGSLAGWVGWLVGWLVEGVRMRCPRKADRLSKSLARPVAPLMYLDGPIQ